MEISKLEAAKRQLDCAIRLYFNDDDMCSVITLCKASFRLLWDLYPRLSQDGFEKEFGKIIDWMGWKNYYAIANFLKHADKDHDEMMEPHEVHALSGIGHSIILYGRITESALSPEMKAWETIMTLWHPDIWDSHPDPEHPQYPDFQSTVAKFQSSSRKERLAMGRGFLRGFQRIEKGLDPDYKP